MGLRDRLTPDQRVTSDRGFTLIEMMVYILLLGVVMIIVVSVFISINTAQNTVTSVVTASNQGQLAANQLNVAVKNSSALSLVSTASGDQMLLTRTAKPGSTVTWICEAWYYQKASNAASGVGSIRFTTSSSAIFATSAAAIAGPSQATLNGWTAIATNITPSTGTTIFSPITSSNGSATVTFAFNSTGKGQKSQLISGAATTPLGNTGSSPCF